jgi:hypothetical protein
LSDTNFESSRSEFIICEDDTVSVIDDCDFAIAKLCSYLEGLRIIDISDLSTEESRFNNGLFDSDGLILIEIDVIGIGLATD